MNDSLRRGYEEDELDFSSLRVAKDYKQALGELMLVLFPANCYMVNRNHYIIIDTELLYKCQRHLGKAQFSFGNVNDGSQLTKYKSIMVRILQKLFCICARPVFFNEK